MYLCTVFVMLLNTAVYILRLKVSDCVSKD